MGRRKVHVRKLFKMSLSPISRDIKGVEEAVDLLPPQIIADTLKSLRTPDWMMLLFKLNARLSDEGWQLLINLSNLGRPGVSDFHDF